MRSADVGETSSARDQLRRRLAVIELRAVGHLCPTEKTGVVDGRRHDRDPSCLGGGQQVVQAGPVEERVATSEHHDVDVALPYEPGGHRRLVHPDPNGVDHSLIAQLDECGDTGGRRLPPVVVGIVQVEDVESVGPEAGEAMVDGTEDAVAAEIPLPPVRRRGDESVVIELAGRSRLRRRQEQASHLRREQILIATAPRERGPEPAL